MTLALPPHLPVISTAPLPDLYERAKTALVQCLQIDECKDWADKAAALASYAKQADDEQLLHYAMRVKARAIRRCGELLDSITPAKNQHDAYTGNGTSRSGAAAEAGLSKRQKDTALRVAKIPAAEFEEALEAQHPPTLEALAHLGTVHQPAIDLGGRDPEEFKLSTEAQAHLERFATLAMRIPSGVAVRGAFPEEHQEMLGHVAAVLAWCLEVRTDILTCTEGGADDQSDNAGD